MHKRKVVYLVAKTATKRAPAPGSDDSYVRPNLATINLAAGAGQVRTIDLVAAPPESPMAKAPGD